MTKEQDTEYRDVTITKVDSQGAGEGWGITSSDGWSFFVPDRGVEPRVGDVARFYGRGLGSIVRGLDVAGKEVFYRTPEQQSEENASNAKAAEQKRRDEFETNKSKLNADYESLPAEFKQRIDGLRERNADFRWEHEPYEMMVCVDAMKLAHACANPQTGDKLRELNIRVKDGEREDTPTGRLLAFAAISLLAFAAINSDVNDYQYKLQAEIIPDLSDGHSGNSFGAVVRLAYLYLNRPELVAKEHGALCPLVGCEDYGCWAATQAAAA